LLPIAARAPLQVLSASLEAQVLSSDNSALARECRQDIKKTTQAMMKLGRKDYQERRALRQELRQLVKEERQRQTKAVYEVLNSSQVSPPWRRLYSSGSQLHECCGDAFSDAAPHNNPGRVLHSVGGPRQGFEEGELRFGGGR